MNIGQRVKELREEAKISGNRLAKLVGLDASQISKIENGAANPSLDSLIRICSALGITLADFFAPTKDGEEPLSPELRRLLTASKRLKARQVELIAEVAEEWAEVNDSHRSRRAAKIEGQTQEAPAVFEIPSAAHKEGFEDIDTEGLLRHVEERAKVVEESEKKKR
ncbi:MAG: helix-turn-helix transcriptional regulator [Bacillota bacterium]|nr:helix-turn-helix transcriptional regulator [Bacillota bacterium]